MDRPRLYDSWRDFYGGHSRSEALSLIEGRAGTIVRKMIFLARYPEPVYKGILKRRLETALGMSLGVHRQLAAGLTSSSRGVILGRAEGGRRR